MKTRFGHVSNSSSSSFIVVLTDREGGFTHNITEDQEWLLHGYGFRYAGGYWKSVLLYGGELYGRREDVPSGGSTK